MERKLVVGIEDIHSVVLECMKCLMRWTYQPDKPPQSIPPNCPHCRAVWNELRALGTEQIKSPFENFIEALPKIREWLKHGKSGFRIMMEFKDES
jgi:hypothetical protein